MTKDRLAALKQAQGDDEEVSVGVEETSCYMEGYFQEVQETLDRLITMEENVEEVKKIHSAILSAPQTDEQTKQQLEQLMANMKQTTIAVRAKLKAFEQDLDQIEPSANSVSSIDYRIRETQQCMLSQKLIAVMKDYNNTQADYRERCKARIQRQLEITGRMTTNEELEAMLESSNPAVFTKGIVFDNTQDIKQTLADIEARHADILKLESSVRELYDLFVDMSLLVDSQGEMVDRIEYHVEHAREYIENAKTDTKRAQEFRNRARKKKIFILFCVCTALALLGLSLGGFINL